MLFRLSTATLFRLSPAILFLDDLLVSDLTSPVRLSSTGMLVASFSARSISPATVLPFVASFSSSRALKRTTPRLLATYNTSATKHCTRYAFLLFVIGSTSLGIAVMSRMYAGSNEPPIMRHALCVTVTMIADSGRL